MRLWLLIALFFGCIGIVNLLGRFEAFSWLYGDEESGSSPNMVKFANGVYTLLLFLLPSVIFANAVLPQKLGYYKLDRKVSFVPVLLGMFTVIVSVFFVDVIYTWNSKLITDPTIIAELERQNEAVTYMLQMPGFTDFLLALLCNAMVPAIAEELFFRGGVQQLMNEWLKKPHVAIVITAAIFSFLHLDPAGFLVKFIIGLFLGYLFYWSGSLRISVMAHFAFNAFGLFDSYYEQHNPDSWWSKIEITWTMAAISFVISLGALLTCRNLLNQQKLKS